jgi:hypothetical protein
MSSRRRKPIDPQELQRRRAERAASEAEITRLRSIGATVKLDPARRIVSAYRASPFVKLRDSHSITPAQADAAERLCTLWAVWRGLDGNPASGQLLRREHASVSAELVTARMLQAGREVRDVLACVGPMDRALLAELARVHVETDAPPPWRDVVRRVCGVTQSVRQSQAIACALENLARAFVY